MPTNPQFLIAARTMIDQLLARGQKPLCFLMNGKTATAIAADMAGIHFQTKSTAAKIWHLLRHRKTPPTLDALHGVPVQQNDYLPDGAMHLQCVPTVPQGMGCPPGMEEAMKAAQAQQAQRGQEFWKKERIEPPAAAEGDAAPTLNDLASGTGDRPSASDVLMKAMERCDDLSGIVVVRVFRNGDVDLCLNVDQFAAQGVLQKAQQYLFMKGM